MLTHNDLLDISSEAEKLTGDELTFYNDQRTTRLCRLSEEIDMEYESIAEQARQSRELDLCNEAAISEYENPVEFQEIICKTPRSTRNQSKKINFETPPSNTEKDDNDNKQDNFSLTPSPRDSVRTVRNVKVAFKDTIATVSYRTTLSVQKARVAVQTVCEKLYSHKYYLSADEQNNFEPSLDVIPEEQLKEPISKKPRTMEQYQSNYKFVLPSTKVVSDFKHRKALHQ